MAQAAEMGGRGRQDRDCSSGGWNESWEAGLRAEVASRSGLSVEVEGGVLHSDKGLWAEAGWRKEEEELRLRGHPCQNAWRHPT